MMDEEKRIVTFVGEGGKRTANIIWKNIFDLFEVDCVEDNGDVQIIDTQFFKIESEAQAFAEKFVWREKYGNV
jgi:hypothetical protein